jgi:uncharacterized protein (DUF1778 family)
MSVIDCRGITRQRRRTSLARARALPGTVVISINKTMRITTEEARCLSRARKALGRPVSQFVQAGVVEAAHKLGFFVRGRPTKPYRGTWLDAPDRGGESTSGRITVTFDDAMLDLIDGAAQYVGVGEAAFILGATFRYLADLKKARPEYKDLFVPPKYFAG